ncbi:Fur family transcriptional regulator [Mycobacterium sp. 21AC1]|uniref:Fur family transcriptional regulator n=1 Tax=[Mycobacterium] appelbergii TaxID=2939269 RepID=UPI00293902C3|nr:Fur family transcriptional regulator [Mycobacterium sp. 21AC1]MDV3126083.1 Fur family transcriptional regulator [Mycobacterium sp. 21AC1]
MPATSPSPAERLRQRLLSALDDARGPMTTAQLRDHVQQRFGQPVVIEAVYRNLTVLERRGDVRRHKGPGRDAHWARATG